MTRGDLEGTVGVMVAVAVLVLGCTCGDVAGAAVLVVIASVRGTSAGVGVGVVVVAVAVEGLGVMMEGLALLPPTDESESSPRWVLALRLASSYFHLLDDPLGFDRSIGEVGVRCRASLAFRLPVLKLAKSVLRDESQAHQKVLLHHCASFSLPPPATRDGDGGDSCESTVAD